MNENVEELRKIINMQSDEIVRLIKLVNSYQELVKKFEFAISKYEEKIEVLEKVNEILEDDRK